jgi:hypothetical protein
MGPGRTQWRSGVTYLLTFERIKIPEMAQTNVLVVEDESIVSKDIQHSLKKLGTCGWRGQHR